MKAIFALFLTTLSTSAFAGPQQAPLPPQAPHVCVVTETRTLADCACCDSCPCAGACKCTASKACCAGCQCVPPKHVQARLNTDEPVLRQAIAGYRAAGGPRWLHNGDLRSHLRAEHRYTEDQLAGLTQTELELLHGWIHEYKAMEARKAVQTQAVRTYQPAYQPSYFQPSFRGACAGGG